MFINDIFFDVETSNIIVTKEDVADFDVTLATIIVPMLIELKNKKDGIPASVFSNSMFNYDLNNDAHIIIGRADWDLKLDTMINAFTMIRDTSNYDRDATKEGLKLFAIYYSDLWC